MADHTEPTHGELHVKRVDGTDDATRPRNRVYRVVDGDGHAIEMTGLEFRHLFEWYLVEEADA